MAKDLVNRRLKIWHRLRHEQPLLASESAQDWITATIERGGIAEKLYCVEDERWSSVAAMEQVILAELRSARGEP